MPITEIEITGNTLCTMREDSSTGPTLTTNRWLTLRQNEQDPLSLWNRNIPSVSVQAKAFVVRSFIYRIPTWSSHLINNYRLFLVQLSSIFELSSSDQSRTSTNYKESVKYSCLPLMTTICEREVIYQREVIFQNLRQHFHSLAHG